jgi:hypothetical protein
MPRHLATLLNASYWHIPAQAEILAQELQWLTIATDSLFIRR